MASSIHVPNQIKLILLTLFCLLYQMPQIHGRECQKHIGGETTEACVIAPQWFGGGATFSLSTSDFVVSKYSFLSVRRSVLASSKYFLSQFLPILPSFFFFLLAPSLSSPIWISVDGCPPVIVSYISGFTFPRGPVGLPEVAPQSGWSPTTGLFGS